MKNYFPPQNQNFRYLQTNRSDRLGSIWSSFNLDFQSKLGTLRVANKLVANTNSTDDADLGRPVAIRFAFGLWWAICGTRMFKTADNLLTSAFTEDTAAFFDSGLADSQFDVTLTGGTTYRYTWDGTGTDPGITALTFPIGAIVRVLITGMASGNEGTFTITGSGANYFEVTNASGVVEANKTKGANGVISVSGGSFSTSFTAELSDMETFNDRLWITTTVGIYSRRPFDDNWILHVSYLNAGGATTHRKLVYFQKFNRLYFKYQGQSIGSIDENDVAVISAGSYFIELGNSIGIINTFAASNDYIWIGSTAVLTTASTGLRGSIMQWDGFSSATVEFVLNAPACLAITINENVPYAVDSNAVILKYTGYSFSEIQRFPIDRVLLNDGTIQSPTNGKFVHSNGFVATRNNTLLILANNLLEDANNTIIESFPSGIWELDLESKNLTHKYAFTLKKRSSSTITDYGQNRILGAGALYLNSSEFNSTLGRSSLVCGASYYTDASATASAIFIDSPAKPDTDNEGQKKGYFVTTWFESNEITDNWTRLWATFRRFLNSADKIILKYRLDEEAPIEATITWTSTTTFTTTTDVSAYAGYEVEILQGAGSGSCNQITTVTFSSPNYTVTLDTAVTGVSGTAKARFQKWIKLGEISGQVLSYGSFPITLPNTRIQIKCCMEFTGDDELHKIILVSNDDLKAIA